MLQSLGRIHLFLQVIKNRIDSIFKGLMENTVLWKISVLLLMSALVSVSGLGGTISTDQYTISWTLNSTLMFGDFGGSGDLCSKMVMKNTGLLHLQVLSDTSVLEQWNFPFTNSSAAFNWNSGYRVTDYDSDYELGRVVMYDEQTDWMKVYSFPAMGSVFTYDNTHTTGLQVDIWDDSVFLLNDNYHIADTGVLQVIATSSFYREWFPLYSSKIAVSSNHQYVVNWNSDSTIKIYQIAPTQDSMTLLISFQECVTSTDHLTDDIAFNQDSTLISIETDSEHPLTVLSLTNYSIVGQYPYNGTIKRTAFVPNSTLILIVGTSDMSVVDMETGTVTVLEAFGFTPQTSMFDDHINYLFLCQRNMIRAIDFNTIEILSSANSNSTNSTSNGTTNSTNTTNGNAANNTTNATIQNSTQSSNSNDILEITMNEEQSAVTALVISGLQTTNSLLQNVIMVALSNPFTYYFLGFINFFTISSHYILLNMPIPQKLYAYLVKCHSEVNSNVIARFWTLPFHPPSTEMVDREKPLNLGVTTDLATGQTANFLMALTNVVIFQAVNCILAKMNKKNLLRKVFLQPQSEIIIGQYVALIMPLTAPWVFFMLRGGVYHFVSKLNLAFQQVLFGFNLVFVIYFLFQLADTQATENARARKKKHKKEEKKILTNVLKSLPHLLVQPENEVQSEAKVNNRAKNEKQNEKKQNKSKQKEKSKSQGKYSSIVNQRQYYKQKSNKKQEQQRANSRNKENRSILKKNEEKTESAKKGEQWRGRKVQWDRLQQKKKQQKGGLSTSKKCGDRRTASKQSPPPPLPSQKEITEPPKVVPSKSEQAFSYEVWQAWYTVLSNFLYPLVLVVEEPWVPLVVLMVYSVLGVGIASGLKELRVSRLILSFYPVLFHICFIIFKVVRHNETLFFTQIACLLILFLGSIHHFFFLIFTFFRLVYIVIKNNNTVTPNNPDTGNIHLFLNAFGAVKRSSIENKDDKKSQGGKFKKRNGVTIDKDQIQQLHSRGEEKKECENSKITKRLKKAKKANKDLMQVVEKH